MSINFFDKNLIDNYKNNLRIKILFIILLFISLILNFKFGFIYLFLYYLIISIFIFTFKLGTIAIKIFWITQFITDVLSVEVVTLLISSLIFKDVLSLKTHGGTIEIILILCILIGKIILLNYHINNKLLIENFTKKYTVIFLFSCFLMQIAFIISIYILSKVFFNIYCSILIIVLFIFNLLLYKIISILSQEYEKLYLLKVNKSQLEFNEMYINEFNKIYENIKSWKHDYRNNMSIIYNLAINNRLSELNTYINDIEFEMEKSEHIIYTNNFILDSLITSKYMYAKANGINITLNIEKIPNVPISDLDFIIILGNVIDNAIEGSLKSKQKKLYILLKINNNNIIIHIKNSTNGKVKIVNGKFISTKNTSLKGIGISRVIMILNKYDGIMLTNHKNNIFETKIAIPLK